MTLTLTYRSLAAAGLSLGLLAACQATALTPHAAAPPAPAMASNPTGGAALTVDSREGGPARLAVSAAMPARGVLYVRPEIHTLELALSRVNGSAETPLASLTLAPGDLGRTVTFDRLKQQATYLIRATARLADGTVISDPAGSCLAFTVGDAQVLIDRAVPVKLLDTPPTRQAATGALTIIDGVLTPPTASLAVRPLEIVSPTLRFEGAVAHVSWGTTGGATVGYDVAIVDALDPTRRFDAPVADAEGGTTHARTVQMGTASSGLYVARVALRHPWAGSAGPATSLAIPYTRPNAIHDVTLRFDGTTATVQFNTQSPEQYDYDVTLTDANGSAFDNSGDTAPTGTTTHTQTLEMTGKPSGTYTATVTAKSTTLQTRSASVPYTAPSPPEDDTGAGIPGGGGTGDGGSTVIP
jgi:hypothetical protein